MIKWRKYKILVQLYDGREQRFVKVNKLFW